MMRFISSFILTAAGVTAFTASAAADIEQLLTDPAQFTSGASARVEALLDGDPSTVWQSDGMLFTIKMPNKGQDPNPSDINTKGLMPGTPLRIRFTVPAGAGDVPTAFAVYGLHDSGSKLETEVKLCHTTARIDYQGNTVYETPTFYVRNEYNEWWKCSHLRFDCTETGDESARNFRLADFEVYIYNEYTIGEGALLRNNGDIIMTGENQSPGTTWYKNLIDENNNTCWSASDYEWAWQGYGSPTGLIISPEPVAEPTAYKLSIGRPYEYTRANGFPTLMRWSYQTAPGGQWNDGGLLDLSTVNPGEIRDFDFTMRPEYYRIRFETIANIGGERLADWAGGQLNTALMRFQLYGPVKSYTPVPDPLPSLGTQYPDPNKVSLNQEFFRSRLYSGVLADFAFEHSHGIVDKNFDNNFHTDGGWLDNLEIWNERGELVEGFEVPGAADGVALPDFSYDAQVNSAEVRPEGSDYKRQPTTTVFHEVLVIPGERVDLIPYSDIWHRSNYMEDFYRFYDYMTDKAHPDVYFLFNPRMGAYSDDGIFGGRALGYVFDDRSYGTFDWNDNGPSLRGPGGVASFYRPRTGDDDEYIDEYIAADYSQHYYTDGSLESDSRRADVKRFIDTDNKTIHEPIINFRHVFHVVDGRKFADESSKDAATNEKFLADALNLFYAPADRDFKIRLINPMPKDDGVHSNRYYCKPDGTYARMGTYEVQTFKFDGYVRGERVDGMFVPDERSVFKTVNTNLVTELNPDGQTTEEWIAPDAEFYRALKCDAENAKTGTYLIRLVAKTPEGERIYLDGGDPEGMSLRDIIITFLDKDHASFELEEDVPYEHSEEYLDENFQTKSSVDFDKYMALSGNSHFMEKDSHGMGERIKYPVPWLNCEYAFGYKYFQDYSAYTIASHTDCVPYAQACRTEWDKHDRLYRNTNGEKQGFFFYANAAGDPGVMARVTIPSVCIGSTIHVSAWINSMGVYMDEDYANNEPANVNFDLVAIMKDGREVNINNFSTGYVPNDPEHCGKWMHAYYSVTPDFSVIDYGNFKINEVDYFQIVLVNNSVNSNGADYAIDDIRIYVSKPVVMASQLEPLCQGDEAVSQRLDLPFRNLVNSLSESVAEGDEPGENVTIYYAIFDKDKYEDLCARYGGFTREVFEGSALPNLTNGGGDYWGAMTFNTNYDHNPAWNKDLAANVAGRFTRDEIDCISFNVILEDGGLYAGKSYIAALSVPGADDLPEWADFDISDACTKQSEFSIMGSTVIKIDGIVKAGASDLEICENQFPVVQVDIYGIEAATGDVRLIERTPLIDWYKGSLDSFAALSHDGVSLDEALLNFRHLYPEARTTDCPFASNGVFSYDETFKAAIDHFIATGELEFASYSFLSDAVRIPDGETSTEYFITVVPANRQDTREIDGRYYTICNDPSELRVKVTLRAPGLLNGFEGVDYPESMKDVPLRAGLHQLSEEIHMPMRSLYIVTPGVAALRRGSDRSIYLVKTDDPEFRDLEADPGTSEEGSGLRQVGEVMTVTALKADPAKSNADVILQGLPFKEGYYYTVRFDYAEDTAEGASDAACDGQAIFTVKVVAAYQKWTGATDESSNFNHDGNWRRVGADELYASDIDDALVSSGANANTFSYSPLGFTRVVIPSGEEYPRLFAPTAQATYNVYDGSRFISQTLLGALSDDPDAGRATPAIEYDMIGLDADGHLYCRFWTANTCDEIHFLPNAELTGQQYLNYRKAWVDMEMEPTRWYTAASPLQGVVAGDMYLPSAGARQETQLFRPVTFSKGVNDRFNPAVYQRGWNKGSAIVYELPSQSAGEMRDVAVALDWSDVYNDVAERYAGGVGYSIKTDISGMRGELPGKVLFRLPKDDESYEYWTQDGLDHGVENGGSIDRTGAGRLNGVDFTAILTNGTSGSYFLVGNPFMAHLDMARFFEVNSDVIAPKYWIMTGDSQQCAVMDAASGGFVATIDDASAVAPLQGFFVEARNEASSLGVRFTPDMITMRPWAEISGTLLRAPGVHRASADGVMRIEAYGADGELRDCALLRVAPDADAGYRVDEDAAALIDCPGMTTRVYTVAGGRALSVNATCQGAATEIGLMAASGEGDVTLRFTGIGDSEELWLLDRLTGEAQPLIEGLEYTVEGSAAGRLYLTAGEPSLTPDASFVAIEIGRGKVVARTIADTHVALQIYDLAGHSVASAEGRGEATVEDLPKGFYIAEGENENGIRRCEKICVR